MSLRKALELLKASGEKHCYFQDGKAFVKASCDYWEYPIKEVFTGSCEIKKFLEILKHNEEFEIIEHPNGLQIKVQNSFETNTFELEKAPSGSIAKLVKSENKKPLDLHFFQASAKVLPFSDEKSPRVTTNNIWVCDGFLVGTNEKILCESVCPILPNGLIPTKEMKKIQKMKIKPTFFEETKDGLIFSWDSGAFVYIENFGKKLHNNYKSLFSCESFESALRYRHFLTDQPEIKIGDSTFETKLLKKVFDVAEFIGFSNGNLEFNGNGFRGILKGAQVEEVC